MLVFCEHKWVIPIDSWKVNKEFLRPKRKYLSPQKFIVQLNKLTKATQTHDLDINKSISRTCAFPKGQIEYFLSPRVHLTKTELSCSVVFTYFCFRLTDTPPHKTKQNKKRWKGWTLCLFLLEAFHFFGNQIHLLTVRNQLRWRWRALTLSGALLGPEAQAGDVLLSSMLLLLFFLLVLLLLLLQAALLLRKFLLLLHGLQLLLKLGNRRVSNQHTAGTQNSKIVAAFENFFHFFFNFFPAVNTYEFHLDLM